MDKFWEVLRDKLNVVAAPRRPVVPTPENPEDNSEHYFDNQHHHSRLKKGNWEKLKNGAEVFVDQDGNVVAGGLYDWHGQPIQQVRSIANRGAASAFRRGVDATPPTENPAYPVEGSPGGFHPSILAKYQDAINAANKSKSKQHIDRVRSRMLAESNEGASFIPVGEMTPERLAALDEAYKKSEALGDFPQDTKNAKNRLEWRHQHLTNIDGLRARLGEGITDDKFGLKNRSDSMRSEFNKFSEKFKQKTGKDFIPQSFKDAYSGPEYQNFLDGKEPESNSITPPVAPTPQMETPEPVIKKKRAPRKSKITETLATPPESTVAPTAPPSSFKYPKGKGIIQDDLSPAAPVIKRPAKTLRDTYYVDPKYRRETIRASEIVKLIIKKSSKSV